MSATVESVLRESIERCHLVAYLAGTREGVPPPEVWFGLDDMLTDIRSTLEAVKRSLPVEALNAEVKPEDPAEA